MTAELIVTPVKTAFRCREAGMTIVELMVACAVGLLIVAAATSLLLSSKAGYIAQDENVRMQESARYALELISRAVHQAGHENWGRGGAPLTNTPEMSAAVSGWDARSLKEGIPGIEAPVMKSVNGSDVLAVRFFGSGADINADGTVLNCAGFAVPEAFAIGATPERGWSIFFVGTDATGEPELRCKYRGKNSWNAEAIGRGVESFQVLYGIDTDADGHPNQFLNATALDQLDETLLLVGPNAVARQLDRNRKTYWKKIVTVTVSLLLRGEQNARTSQQDKRYDLFGEEYSRLSAATDPGTRIHDSALPAASRNRLRKIFSMTIQVRGSALPESGNETTSRYGAAELATS